MCPSCIDLFDEKPALEQHVNEQHLVFDAQHSFSVADDTNSEWTVSDLNMTRKFNEFRDDVIKNSHKYTNLDQFFHQLLAMSSILFIQRRNFYNNIPEHIMDPQIQQNTRTVLLNELNFRRTLQPGDHEAIKAILTEYRDDIKDMLDVRIDLLTMAKAKPEPERNVLLAIEGLIPTLKDLDLPCLSSENHLTAGYIHPVIQHLFAHNPSHIAQCANILPRFENADKRPDYFVQKFEHYQYASTFCFGEIKVDTANDISCLNDFYRLALFAKTEMDTSHMNAVICFQTIGLSTTFYIMTRKPNMLVFVELVTIVLPSNKPSIMSILGYLDDLYSLATLHMSLESTCQTSFQIPYLTIRIRPIHYQNVAAKTTCVSWCHCIKVKTINSLPPMPSTDFTAQALVPPTWLARSS
ncbi:hypothetical protein DM01DRAFT_1403976 [Hesseltinella vesiculosa]|uniref:C2H2-type domain-containing protein n=1 Tax=Hesseltinella vesiculosa TaxID=101127 RepID=A0A1X2GXH4_9FUNG|nr:hypothetical protein DM01DRAFT_1403976 [Hesseltinella vesiculosa]